MAEVKPGENPVSPEKNKAPAPAAAPQKPAAPQKTEAPAKAPAKPTGRAAKAAAKDAAPLGPELSFASTEAYKLLRTNLLFSFSDEKKCHVVGITSSLRGEGKTTTSINTAYMLAQTGRHVLVIEADMRLPAASGRLDVPRSPGLSNLLVNGNAYKDVIKKTALHDNLYILPAGDIPPNPSELLGSQSMKNVMDALSAKFDFILVDLPPLNAVSDALVVSKNVDGMVLVVSRDYTTRSALAESMNQLKIADAKILGFVFTRGELPASGKFKKYYKYKNYGYK